MIFSKHKPAFLCVSPSLAQNPQWPPFSSGRKTKLYRGQQGRVAWPLRLGQPLLTARFPPPSALEPHWPPCCSLGSCFARSWDGLPSSFSLLLFTWPGLPDEVKSPYSRFSGYHELLGGTPVPAALLPINVILPLTYTSPTSL